MLRSARYIHLLGDPDIKKWSKVEQSEFGHAPHLAFDYWTEA
ncbi:MAG: hypothetical protein QXV46_06985 [Candidatus Bathyarchaeia archaeon]